MTRTLVVACAAVLLALTGSACGGEDHNTLAELAEETTTTIAGGNAPEIDGGPAPQNTPAPQNDVAAIARQLTEIDLGAQNVTDERVAIYTEALTATDSRCAQNAAEVADIAVRGSNAAANANLTLSSLEMLEVIYTAVPEEAGDSLDCFDIAQTIINRAAQQPR